MRERAVRMVLDNQAQHALCQGADDFMTKPFSPDELIARIARFAPAGKCDA